MTAAGSRPGATLVVVTRLEASAVWGAHKPTPSAMSPPRVALGRKAMPDDELRQRLRFDAVECGVEGPELQCRRHPGDDTTAAVEPGLLEVEE